MNNNEQIAEKLYDDLGVRIPKDRAVPMILQSIERATTGVNELLHEATKLLANSATYEQRQAFYTKVNKFEASAQPQPSKGSPASGERSERSEPRTKCPTCGQVIPLHTELQRSEQHEWTPEIIRAIAGEFGTRQQLEVLSKAINHNAKLHCNNTTYEIKVDLSALHEHDAKVREPLVEALQMFLDNGLTAEAITAAYDALEKVKEQ